MKEPPPPPMELTLRASTEIKSMISASHRLYEEEMDDAVLLGVLFEN